MIKCISCQKREGEYPHYDGGFVCGDCLGRYFTCQDCGTVFNKDDHDGDAGTGFCVRCEQVREN